MNSPARKAMAVVTGAVVAWFALSSPAFAQSDADTTLARTALTPVQRQVERVTLSGSAGAARMQPGTAGFVGPDPLLHRNQTYIDPARVLRWLPGVYAFDAGASGLQASFGMRGVTPWLGGWTTLLEDGIPATGAPYAAPEVLCFPALGRMESVEALAGSGAVRFGPHSSGGTVNLSSFGTPDDLVGRAVLGAGSDGAGAVRVHYGDSWQNASWFFGTGQSRTDGFQQLDGGGDTGFDSEDYLVKLRLRSGLNAERYQEVLFKFGYQENDANAGEVGLTDADFATTPYRRYAATREDHRRNEASQILLRHFIAVDDAIDVTTTLYRNDLRFDATQLETIDGAGVGAVVGSPGAFGAEYTLLTGDSTSADDALGVAATRRDQAAVGIRTALGLGFEGTGGRHGLEIGARFHKDEDDLLRRHDAYRMESGGDMVRTSTGSSGGTGAADNRVDRAYALTVFAEDRFVAGPWSVTPGIRIEHVRLQRTAYDAPSDGERATTPAVDEFTRTVALPGVGATYRAGPVVRLLAGVHTGFQPPRPGVATDPARSVHAALGARADRGQTHVALIGFATTHTDLPAWRGDSTVVAAGESRAWGVEVSGGWGVHTPEYGVELSASYAYTHATFESEFTPVWESGVYIGDRVPYVPPHAANASLVLTTNKTWAGVYADYASRVPTTPTSGELADANSLDARFLLDITTEFQIISYVRVFASVYNVTDEVWMTSRFPAGAFPGAPRTFATGLKFEL